MTGFHEAIEAECKFLYSEGVSRGVYADWLEEHDKPTIAGFVRKWARAQRLWSYDGEAQFDTALKAGNQWVAWVDDQRKIAGARCWEVQLREFAPTAKEWHRVWAMRQRFAPDKLLDVHAVLMRLQAEGVHLLPYLTEWVEKTAAQQKARK